jgi:hypothetical protein
MRRWGPAPSGRGPLLAACVAILLCHPAPHADLRAYRGLQPAVPEAARPSRGGTLYLNLAATYTAPLYLSPTEGGLVSEWPGGTRLMGLGSSFDDGYAGWQLVRDPSGNDGWVAELFLDGQLPAADPQADEDYLASVRWDGEIVYCSNPTGGPPGLDGDAFVALVERAAARWQEVGEGALPLASRGRCEHDPTALGDGMSTIGWVDDLGLAIAAQAWPDAEHGVVGEIDIRVSRGYFLRLRARDPTKAPRKCVFSTLVHELGHLLGLDHPRSRTLPSSMQAVGAARCDKAQPSASDKEHLLRRYAPARIGLP